MARHLERLLLAALVLVFFSLQARFTWVTIGYATDTLQIVERPFNVDLNSLEVKSLSEEAKAAGMQEGDKLLAIDGTPVDSAVRARTLTFHHPVGSPMTLRLQRDSRTFELAFTPRKRPGPTVPIDVVIPVVINIVIPWFCLLLGTLVVLRRPGSSVAWALLAMMFSLSQLQRSEEALRGGTGPPLSWAMALADTSGALLPVAWMWFAVLFPDPRSPHRLWPWLRWVLGPSFAVLLMYPTVIGAAQAHQPHALAGLPVWNVSGTLALVLVASNLILGFANFFHKLSKEKRPAARRRLQWMLAGLALGILPMTALILSSFWFKNDINEYPRFVLWPAIFSPISLPLTLAYAVLVDRVIDVGVFVRQGLLASRSVLAMRILVVAALVWYAFVLASQPSLGETRWLGVLGCLAAVPAVHLGAERLRRWVDRRFFQEAVNTEAVLLELSRQVRHIPDPAVLLGTVTQRLREALHVTHVTALLPEGGGFTGEGIALPAGHETVKRMARERGPVVIGRREEGWTAEVLLPLGTDRGLDGILALGPKRSEEPYSKGDLRLLESVADQTALALENARLAAAYAEEAAQRERIGRELEIAREVQQRLFPKAAPWVAGLVLEGRCVPAESIGGDYYDFIETPSGEIGLAIGDVAGKGIPAALLMAGLQASLRGLTLAGVSDLAQLMTKLNRLVYDASPANRFATFFYGLYDPASRRLRYSSAGHNPSLLLRAGAPQWLRTRGVGLGLARTSRFEEGACVLEPGDLLVLYTDGVTEARNAAGDEFGEERLVAAAQQGSLEAILAAVEAFEAGAPRHDDITIIIARAG
ncbi:MAG: SpoIIE family protein phosphatase [Bryobacteraceae bacterium]|nr:SpoIIE family protein phosphatase [Bryobacteraceae bacterium]